MINYFQKHLVLIFLVFALQNSYAQTFKILDKSTNINVTDYEIFFSENTYIFGKTTITIVHPEYRTFSIEMTSPRKKDTVVFYLTPSTLKMNEVVVSANKFTEKYNDVPRQIQSISKANIQFQNRQNTGDLLEQNGNVFVQKSQQGGASPVLRGFESNRVLLVVDGVRMNNAIFRGGHLQNVLRIDQNMLAKTEILFGGGSVIYGSDAIGGVMYFETMKPILNKNISNGYLRYGSVNNESTFHYDANIGFKKWAHLISITNSSFGDLRQGTNKENVDGDSIYQRNYYATRINNRDTMTKNSDPALQIGTAYSQYDLMYKALFQQNNTKQHVFSFQLSNTNNVPRYDKLNQWNGKTYKSAEWYYGPELRTMTSYQFTNNLKQKYADKYKLTLAYQYIEESRNDRNWQSLYLNKRSEFVHVTSLNLDGVKTIKQNPNSIHEIRYGFDGQFNDVTSNAHSVNILNGSKTNIPTRYPDGGSNMVYMAAFVSHSWEIGKKFIISDGLRYNYVSLNSTFNDKTFFPFLENTLTQKNNALNGNLGLVYNPIKNLKLYTNASTAFRAPNLDDVNKVFDSKFGNKKDDGLIIPNAYLQPEYTYNYELGISTIYKKIKLEAVGYYTQIQNAIVVKPSQLNGQDSAFFKGVNTKVFSNINAQQAYIYGYSMQLSADLFKSIAVTSSLNYTYGRIVENGNETPLDHIPPMFGRTAISYFTKKFSAEISSLYNGWKNIENFNLNGEDNAVYATPKGSPAWYTLNVKAQYALGKKGKIQLQSGIDNITDTQYRVFASGMSAAGRNIWVCLRVKI
ncbi:MAG: TonB-dependent receptor plug domain-containing protein [Bacteroidia bacterium]